MKQAVISNGLIKKYEFKKVPSFHYCPHSCYNTLLLWRKKYGKKAKDNFINFNNSNLNDKLLGIDYYAKGVKIIFKNNKYVFYPHTSNLNHNSIFNATAEIGDSIYKKQFQEILTLKKKNGKEYKYLFQKFK